MTTFPITSLEPSDWKDLINHQSDTSRLASVDASASTHFSTGKSFDSCTEAALAAPETTFLVKTSSYSKPVIVHGAIECRSMTAGVVSKVHGIHQGTKKPAMLFGIDTHNFFENIDPVDQIDFDSLGNKLSSVTFNEAGTVPDPDGRKITDLRSAMFLPPVLAKLLFGTGLDFTAGEMACHIMSIVRVESLGDTESAESTFSIPEEYQPLIMWLYLFDDLKAVALTPVFEGSALTSASKVLHDSIFRSVPISTDTTNAYQASAQPINEMMLNSTALQCEQNEYLKAIAGSMERSGKGRRGFDRMPQSTKAMILACLTKDGITPATDISQTGRDIFDARTDSDAHIALRHAMESAGHYYIEFSPAQAKSISSGIWRWSGNSPGGISMLLFNPFDPSSDFSLEKAAMVLHLKMKHGMDSVTLKSLTETDVVLPIDAECTIQRLAVAKFLFSLFGQGSLLEKNLDVLIHHVRQNIKIFQQMIAERSTFIAEFLCAVDTRINDWLDECNRSPYELQSVDSNIIQFYDIITDLKRRRFYFSPLPPCIFSIKQNSGADADQFDDVNPKGPKKPKLNTGTVDNPHHQPEWKLKDGENFAAVFGRPEDLGFRPAGVCLRFHVKGYCFNHCKHPHVKPTVCQASLITAFMKRMRARVANMVSAASA